MWLRGFILLSALLAAVMPAASQSAAPVIKTANHAVHGTYLVSGTGMSLYLFEEDRRGGDRGRPVETDCLGECLERWPPMIVSAPPKTEGDMRADFAGAFTRPDGRLQATYNGWPLYFFAEDFVPGDVNGHDFEEFGGEWYLLAPDGFDVAGKESDEGGHGHGRNRGGGDDD